MRRLSFAVIVTGLIAGMIGLLNAGLGARAVYSGASASVIGVGTIVFGLVMLTAGAFWVTSAVGYFTSKEWASMLALYASPVIVAINLIGVLHLWGFIVNVGWAALSTVAGVGSICYLSKKELASFFLISVAEHIGILAVFAMLIYGEPVDIAESTDTEMIVTIEEVKQQDPLLAEIIPRERAVLEKPPILPKIEVQPMTATDPGTEIEGSAPQLPKTVAQVMDPGADLVLRSPGPKEREQRYQDTVPALDMESALDSSKKPSPEIGPSEKARERPEVPVAREPEYIRDDVLSPDERLGPSDEVARPSFVGDITGEVRGRKVISYPRPSGEYKGAKGGVVSIKFWVDPAGNITKVEISKKSGSPRLDKIAREYVEQIRFEELPKNVQQRIQWGEISIDFELTGRTG